VPRLHAAASRSGLKREAAPAPKDGGAASPPTRYEKAPRRSTLGALLAPTTRPLWWFPSRHSHVRLRGLVRADRTHFGPTSRGRNVRSGCPGFRRGTSWLPLIGRLSLRASTGTRYRSIGRSRAARASSPVLAAPRRAGTSSHSRTTKPRRRGVPQPARPRTDRHRNRTGEAPPNHPPGNRQVPRASVTVGSRPDAPESNHRGRPWSPSSPLIGVDPDFGTRHDTQAVCRRRDSVSIPTRPPRKPEDFTVRQPAGPSNHLRWTRGQHQAGLEPLVGCSGAGRLSCRFPPSSGQPDRVVGFQGTPSGRTNNLSPPPLEVYPNV
jgi:hypothetical protein